MEKTGVAVGDITRMIYPCIFGRIYGMVQFEGGGRALTDFTDCSLDDVAVGVEMKMTFRKKYHDPKRGFTGYFWKAAPANPTGK
jgi:hypothetical protein